MRGANRSAGEKSCLPRKAVEQSPVTGMGLWDGSNAAAESPSESPDYFSTPEQLSGTSGMPPTDYFATCGGVCFLTDPVLVEHQGLHITGVRNRSQGRAGHSSHLLHINSACFAMDLMICGQLG